MIYLLGISHDIQTGNAEELCKKFEVYLKEQSKNKEFDILVEEWSEDASKCCHIDKTTVQKIASDLDLDPRYCDPSIAERKRLGIPTRKEIWNKPNIQSEEDVDREESKYHPKRELFWYNQIKDILNNNIIFICGEEHLSMCSKFRKEGFDTLLNKKGHDVQVLDRKFVSESSRRRGIFSYSKSY